MFSVCVCMYVLLLYTSSRWTRLLKQQSSVTVDREGKKPLFSVSIGDKQTEVCRLRFPFAAKSKWEFLFSASSVFRMWGCWGVCGGVCGCVYNTFKFIFIQYSAVLNEKRKTKPRRFSSIRIPFAYSAIMTFTFH